MDTVDSYYNDNDSVATIPEGKIAGVCAWLAQKFDFDVTIIRLIFVFSTIFGFGSPLLIYIILALVKPDANEIG